MCTSSSFAQSSPDLSPACCYCSSSSTNSTAAVAMMESSSEMASGVIKMEMVKNQRSRPVTYSNRRYELFKKAHELTVMCDAKVSIIIFSPGSKRRHEYCSPCTSHKEILGLYQEVRGVDLWNSCSKKMEDDIETLMKTNASISKKIRQRMGEELGHLTIEELCGLEQNMQKSVGAVRDLKEGKMQNELNSIKERIMLLQDLSNKNLKQELTVQGEMEIKEEIEEGIRAYGSNMENYTVEANNRSAADFDFKPTSPASPIFVLHDQPCLFNASHKIHGLFHLQI